jgi:predicted regulator of Ras-like GTPase activity (Roadblock/LC7/MglB family)
MDDALDEIVKVSGVAGAFLCRSNGEVLASTLNGVDRGLLESVGRTFGRTLDGLRTARKKKVVELDLVYESGRLVVKNMGDACLVISCAPSINVPLLNLTTNLAVRKLRAMVDGGQTPASAALPAAAPARVSAGPSASAAPAPEGSPSLTQGLLSIAAKHKGDAGKEFFLHHLADAHLGKDASLEQLVRWLPGFGYALTYTADPTDGQLRVEEMMIFLEKQSR